MKKQNSRKDLDLQLKQGIIANFRYYVNVASTSHKIRPLCYYQVKANWSRRV